MAGRGPAPKHPSRRNRRNSSPELRIIGTVDTAQPALPEGVPWPAATVAWWQMWADAPQAAEFGQTDWAFLMETALLHADFWSGNLDRAAELRIRVAKFGATPEDRARLRIQYAQAEIAADEATTRAEKRVERRRRQDGTDPRAALTG